LDEQVIEFCFGAQDGVFGTPRKRISILSASRDTDGIALEGSPWASDFYRHEYTKAMFFLVIQAPCFCLDCIDRCGTQMTQQRVRFAHAAKKQTGQPLLGLGLGERL